MRNIWLDGIIGVAVGDALGLPVQFKSREYFINNPVTEMIDDDLFGFPKGTWSDDTSMTLAMFDSIIKNKGINIEDIMYNFESWLYDGKYCSLDFAIDVGETCETSIANFHETKNIYTCGKTGERANGNGSLMRTLPICLYYAERVHIGISTVDEAIKNIHAVSALTHNHTRACIACGLYYFIVSAVIYDEGDLLTRIQNGINKGFDYYEEYKFELSYYGRFLDLEEFVNVDQSEIKSSGYVVDSFEAAIWSLINTKTYKDAMIKAVNLGDDTDTIAAIAGGIAGLYYGYNNIPQDWLKVLKKRDMIEQMCNEFKGELNMIEKAYKIKYGDKWVEIIRMLGNYDYKLHDNIEDVKLMTLNQAMAAKGLLSGDFKLNIDKIEVIKC